MIRYSFRKYSLRSFIPNFSLPTCIVMSSREGEEGTKESQDDYEADHEGKEPVRRKLPQRRAKLSQMVGRTASGDALGPGTCKLFEVRKSTGTEKVKETSISPKVDARIKVEVTRGSTGNWKSWVADSTPKSDAVDNSAVTERPQSDLTAFKQSLMKVCRVTGRPEPHISCTYADGWHMVEVIVRNEGLRIGSDLWGSEEEAQGKAAKMWLEKYQPDWRQLLRPSGSTASALGTGEEGLVEMELADESNISVRVEGEESNNESLVILETDEELPDKDEVNILKAVSQKMKLEVNAKNQELKGLRARKEKAIKDLHSITSKISAVQKKTERKREYLELDQQEEVADRRRLEALEQEIQERKYRKKELLKVMEQRQARMRHQTAVINWRKARETRLENQRQNALEQIRIAEEQIADLPNATGYSHKKLDELEVQIADKKSELECPVCFEEAVPPILQYSPCVAQHLVSVPSVGTSKLLMLKRLSQSSTCFNSRLAANAGLPTQRPC